MLDVLAKRMAILVLVAILFPFAFLPVTMLSMLLSDMTGLSGFTSFLYVAYMFIQYARKIQIWTLYGVFLLECQYSWEKSATRRWLEQEDKNWDEMIKRLQS